MRVAQDSNTLRVILSDKDFYRLHNESLIVQVARPHRVDNGLDERRVYAMDTFILQVTREDNEDVLIQGDIPGLNDCVNGLCPFPGAGAERTRDEVYPFGTDADI